MPEPFWADFENAPHIPVLLPLVKDLRSRGYEPLMTARDFSFTTALVRRYGLPARILGRGSASGSPLAKALRVAQRVVLLVRAMAPHRRAIRFTLAHASRSQLIAARLLGIPSVSLEDYEHSSQFHNGLSTYLLVPEPIPFSAFPRNRGEILHYPGIKEEIYLCEESLPEVDPREVPLDPDRVNVLFRPEGSTAHYRSPEGEALQESLLRHLGGRAEANLLVYPRDPAQQTRIETMLRGGKARFAFPSVTAGPSVVASVDLVVGGGGTMTREAAVLGIPSCSFFQGRWGAVDLHLEARGLLVRLKGPEDIALVHLEKRTAPPRRVSRHALEFLCDLLDRIGSAPRGGRVCT